MRRSCAILALLLASCGSGHHIKGGTVVEQVYDPPQTQLMPITNCTPSPFPNYPPICSTSWVPINYPEHHYLRVHGCDLAKDKCYTEDFEVDSSTWHEHPVGSHYGEASG